MVALAGSGTPALCVVHAMPSAEVAMLVRDAVRAAFHVDVKSSHGAPATTHGCITESAKPDAFSPYTGAGRFVHATPSYEVAATDVHVDHTRTRRRSREAAE